MNSMCVCMCACTYIKVTLMFDICIQMAFLAISLSTNDRKPLKSYGNCINIQYLRCYKYECNTNKHKLHGYTVHQIMLNTFYYQLTHTTLKNVELLKHSILFILESFNNYVF